MHQMGEYLEYWRPTGEYCEALCEGFPASYVRAKQHSLEFHHCFEKGD